MGIFRGSAQFRGIPLNWAKIWMYILIDLCLSFPQNFEFSFYDQYKTFYSHFSVCIWCIFPVFEGFPRNSKFWVAVPGTLYLAQLSTSISYMIYARARVSIIAPPLQSLEGTDWNHDLSRPWTIYFCGCLHGRSGRALDSLSAGGAAWFKGCEFDPRPWRSENSFYSDDDHSLCPCLAKVHCT